MEKSKTWLTREKIIKILQNNYSSIKNVLQKHLVLEKKYKQYKIKAYCKIKIEKCNLQSKH